jgi:hypothetical protein
MAWPAVRLLSVPNAFATRSCSCNSHHHPGKPTTIPRRLITRLIGYLYLVAELVIRAVLP